MPEDDENESGATIAGGTMDNAVRKLEYQPSELQIAIGIVKIK